ncbi:MAG: C-GCAxxG-C-C family protein [Lachnospiraceae bacterium]|nr:C-GCAxxG-C-C family protein [Lachnospiraceae bacterium]
MTKKELATLNHNKGYNCCQAVVCAYSKELGIPEDVLFKAAEGFGLGMGGMECTCGAVSGAVMVAGLKNSTAALDAPNSKASTYQLSKKLSDAFCKKNGSVICKDLKGIETGNVLRSCAGCIEDAVELIEEML